MVSIYIYKCPVGIPEVSNVRATDNCLDVKASWSPITGTCSNSQFTITLLPASRLDMTYDTSYTFNDTVSLTGDIFVSVVALNGDAMGTSKQVVAQRSRRSKLHAVIG